MSLFTLISSLPYLTLFEQPGITSEKFLYACSTAVSEKEMNILRNLILIPAGSASLHGCPENSISAAYPRWEAALRNSIAGIRAARRAEHGPAVRMNAGFESDAESAARRAYAAADPLERERILDQARWNKLDELLHRFSRHSFSFDAVCVYRLKLLIAEKWPVRKAAAVPEHLDRTAWAVRAGKLFTEQENKQSSIEVGE